MAKILATTDIYCKNTTDGFNTIFQFNFSVDGAYKAGVSYTSEQEYASGAYNWRDIPILDVQGRGSVSGMLTNIPSQNVVLWGTLRNPANVAQVYSLQAWVIRNGSTTATEIIAPPLAIYEPEKPKLPVPSVVINHGQIENYLHSYLDKYGLQRYVSRAADLATTYATAQNRMPRDENEVLDMVYAQDAVFYREMISARGTFQEDLKSVIGEPIEAGPAVGIGSTIKLVTDLLPLIIILSVVQSIKK